MTDNSQRTLERIAHRVPVPELAYDRFLRRRDRKERNRRLSAAVLATVLTIVSVAALTRAFGNSERPAQPTPTVENIFSGMGGWIAYADPPPDPPQGGRGGVWAMDPERRQVRVQLSAQTGEPLAWSSDGSKLLILRPDSFSPNQALYVLNADGSETLLLDADADDLLMGASFSLDGSEVVFGYEDADDSDSGLYVIDADGGTPRRLLEPRGLWAYGPTFSPDGSQIAYFDGWGDHDNTLRVMNADGTDSRVLLKNVGMMRNSAGLRSLTWSQDGGRLMFGVGYGPYRTYTVDANGLRLTRLPFNGQNPAWSPDGTRIGYEVGWRTASNSLVIADVDGTHVQRFNYALSGPWNPLVRSMPDR